MCFSAESSLAAAAVLLPLGAYSTAAAALKDRTYLPFALTPLLFGVQQVCEAGVWAGLHHGHPLLVRASATAFLFFAVALWPAWVPFAAAVLDHRPRMRRLFAWATAVGAAVGLVCYLPAVLNYGDWLEVVVAGRSIRYDFSRLPGAQTPLILVTHVVYLAVVCGPLLLSRERRLWVFGGAVLAAAVVSQVVFRAAFLSVWCFFAAALSVHICYITWRLPPADGRAGATRARKSP